MKWKYINQAFCVVTVLFMVVTSVLLWTLFHNEKYYYINYNRGQSSTSMEVQKLKDNLKKLEAQYTEMDARFKEVENKFGLARRVDYYIMRSREEDHESPLSFPDVEAISIRAINLSVRYKIPIEDLLALWRLESKFNKKCVGKRGERGLGQVRENTHQEFGKGDFTDWEATAETSARYWVYLRGLFGDDLDRRYSSYNTGPNISRERTFQRSGRYVPVVKRFRKEAMLMLK